MTMDLKDKYINLSTKLFYNKHFYKLLLEKKYIENFGDIEITKMRNIYEAMIINKKLEESFSIYNDNSIQYNNLVEYRARKEFFDLARQIKELETNIKENAKLLKELEFFFNKSLDKAIEILVSKSSPYINKTQKAKEIWLEFTSALEDGNWKRIIRLSNQAKSLRVYKPKLDQGELEAQILDMESQIVALKNRFPFTKLDILSDEKSIKNIKDQETKDVRSMQESYQRMTDIYLSTSSTPEWFS